MKNEDIRQFRLILRRFERELERQNNSSCCCGVTVSQCHALLEIDNKKKCSLNELAKALDLDKSTVSRTIDGLVKSGLVIRVIPENNRRTTNLSLTKLGVETCYSIHKGNDDYYSKVLSSLPVDYKKPFISGFKLLIDNMQKINNEAGS